MASTTQLEALALGRIDLGLVRPACSMGYAVTCVMREGLALALPLTHPLVGGDART